VKYLVTGGAGFIGSNLVEELLKLGHQVRVIDNFLTGRRENLEAFKNDIDLHEADICDFAAVEKAVKGIDAVLHQAALPSVPRSVEDPITSNQINIDGTLNVLEASKRAGVSKYVMASSSSVYGESEELPKHEKMMLGPLSPYAVCKLTDEHYSRIYWELYKLPTVCLRYFNVFGPRQDPGSEYAAVIPKFITSLQNGKQPIVYGDGEQSRDFTYIDNVVNANLLAVENDSMAGQAFNAACGSQYTLNQLLDRLREIISSDVPAIYDAPRAGDIKHSFAAIEKIKACGFEPTIGFAEGLKKTVEYFASLG
jgi:UDP-glucose 4-epimerase